MYKQKGGFERALVIQDSIDYKHDIKNNKIIL